MAIEPIKKVTIISPNKASKRLMRVINRLGVMEIADLEDSFQQSDVLEYHEAQTIEEDDHLHKIDFILSFMDIFSPEEQSFTQGLTPLPLVTTEQELSLILREYDLEEKYRAISDLEETYRGAERVIGEIESELAELEPIKDLPFDLKDFYSPKSTRLLLGYIPKKNLHLLSNTIEPWTKAVWEEIKHEDFQNEEDSASAKIKGSRIRMLFAFLAEDADDIRKALSSVEFDEIQLPKVMERIIDRIHELKGDLSEYKEKVSEISNKIKLMTESLDPMEGRRPLKILKAYWQNSKERQIASARAIQSNWVHVIGGYIRKKDIDTLESTLKQELPESEITIQDPSPDENVPVSLSVPYLFRPIQLLVEMFGLPPYRAFDPTPFLQINFYLFFGICFSDVGYGLMLVLFSSYLATKTRVYKGVHNFSRILLYGGISSIIFGAILGSWFGDLYKPEYLGENNILLKLQQTFMLLDPMDKTIIALVAALAIGVMNQFYGLILKMFGALRSRDWMSAFSDGVCWIVTLTGVLIMVSKIFIKTNPSLFNAGKWAFYIGALCLVLTQARDIKNIFGRLAGGLVSLYGIMGSYGITAFIGDTLSYCRLLALGLTTSIVAMAFNLMAGMLKDIPYVGFILFIILLLIGHVFNFAISVLGAFVHSMRLIFVEFFGRFYETGARPFQPLGFDSDMCIMKKTEERA